MDTRQYFRKLREIEATIAEEFPVIISVETSDGGKAGLATEVSRSNAAKMLLDRRATLAGEAEKAEYRARQAAAKEALQVAELARTVQISISDIAGLNQSREKKQITPSGSSK